MDVAETKASLLFHVECKLLAEGVVGLRKQVNLVNLTLSMQLLNVCLLIILIMGTFVSSAADLWLFDS